MGSLGGGAGGVPVVGSLAGAGSPNGVSSSDSIGMFADYFNIFKEKLCDFALNEAARFADFWVLVPATSIEVSLNKTINISLHVR